MKNKVKQKTYHDIKLILFALAAIIGITTAFTTKEKKFNGTTWYAVSWLTFGFYWTTIRPNRSFYHCVSGTPYCTIITLGGYIPIANEIPNASQATPVSPSHSLYAHN